MPSPPLPVLGELLISENADEDDCPDDGEVERARNPEQIDEILEHLQQDRAEHDADNRPLAATQRAAT